MVYDIWATFLEVVCTILMFSKFINRKVAGRLKYDVLYTVVVISWIEFVNISGVHSLWTMLGYAISFLYLKIVYKTTTMKTLTVLLEGVLFVAVLEILLAFPMLVMENTMLLDMEQGGLVNSGCLVICSWIYFRDKESKINFSVIRERIKATAGVLCCGIVFLYLVRFKMYEYMDKVDYFLILSFIIAIAIILNEWQKLVKTMRQKEKEIKTIEVFSDAFDAMINTIRRRQHEFDNHLNAIVSQHITIATYEELVQAQSQYIQQLVADNRLYPLLLLDHPILSGFLYSKFSEQLKNGVDISFQIDVSCVHMEVPIVELVEVLGGAMDNAFTALEKEPLGERKFRFMLTKETEFYRFTIMNQSKPIPESNMMEFFKKGYTSKENPENHGIGLYNIKNIVNTYDGNVRMFNKGKWLQEDCVCENWICLQLDLK